MRESLVRRFGARRSDCTAKLLRAHGGCLGVMGRRRTWQAAKSYGELSTALIRGFPNGETQLVRMPALRLVNHIAVTREPRGTETSQYPEEKRLFP